MAETKTHYKKLRNPNYLGGWDLEQGKDTILTITGVTEENVYDPQSREQESCMTIRFKGAYKPLICNATNAKNISKALGSPYIEDWTGKSVALYVTKVKAFGDTVDAVRVREYAPKPPVTIKCSRCGKDLVPAQGMQVEDLAAYTKKNYNAVLCADCARQIKKEQTES